LAFGSILNPEAAQLVNIFLEAVAVVRIAVVERLPPLPIMEVKGATDEGLGVAT
jgi:hypothetical protein